MLVAQGTCVALVTTPGPQTRMLELAKPEVDAVVRISMVSGLTGGLKYSMPLPKGDEIKEADRFRYGSS